METIHTEKRNGFDIEITYDEYSDSPAEWGNFTLKHWRDVDGVDVDEHKILPELQAKFDDGRAFWVDKYEHSAVRYSLAGEGMQDRFDTSSHWGIIEFDDAYIKDTTFDERKEYARGDLETYTLWANGDVYYVNISENGEMIDGGGGNIGELSNIIKQAQETVDRLTPARDSTRAPRASRLHA